MNPQHWRRIEDALHGALAVEIDRRPGYLAATLNGDTQLVSEVEKLLAALDRAGNFLEQPADDPFTHRSPRSGAEIGHRIGPYRILRRLGEGGMSTVYLAERVDREYRQQVALKRIKPGLDSDNVVRRFRAERQILASLEHPHIARIYDGGTAEDGRPYLVMERIEGQRIDSFCEDRCLSLRQRVELVIQLCSAVQYAHQNLIIHRDIKPSNVLVTGDGVPKLLDFGIAKLLDARDGASTREDTCTGLLLMTPDWASPEQRRGQRLTTATDVYSLGLLLHKILRGHLPRRPDADASPLPVARDLDKVVQKALCEAPEQRYASAEQLAEDLRRYLAGLPVRAETPTWGYRMGKFLRRHRLAVGVAAAFTAVVLGFSIALLWQVEETREQRDRAQIERDRAAQVSQLMFDLFEGADPAKVRGNTLTAREILDQGAARAERKLASQPAVQAAALDTIGRVYDSLGLYDQALPMLEKALALRRQRATKAPLEAATSLTSLGALLTTIGRYPRAEELHREALRLRRRELGEGHRQIAASRSHLALAVARQERLSEALQLQQQALRWQRRELAGNDLELAESLSHLAYILYQQGDARAAVVSNREALAIRQQSLGADHPDVADDLHHLAAALTRQGHLQPAGELHREALELNRRIFGEQHPRVAGSLQSLGIWSVRSGQATAGEQMLRQALDMRRQIQGDQHPDVARCWSAFAYVLRLTGQLEAAASAYRESLAISRRWVDRDDPGPAFALTSLGKVLLDLEQYEAAVSSLREAYEIRKRALASSSPLLAQSAEALAIGFVAVGEYVEAEQRLVEAERIYQSRNSAADKEGSKQVRARLRSLHAAMARQPTAGALQS